MGDQSFILLRNMAISWWLAVVRLWMTVSRLLEHNMYRVCGRSTHPFVD